MTNEIYELQRLLEERNVKYRLVKELGKNTLYLDWNDQCGGYTKAICVQGACVTAEISYLSPEQAIAATLGSEINGDTSDGYHTFNELYHHRAVLFSVVVASHRNIAWKSKLHHDGTMYEGMFIVGVDTPWGQASYHYDIDPYWDMFDCEERESAPEWDGHTPDEAIERIGKLATLGGGKLTREDVQRALFAHSTYASYDGLQLYASGIRTQEISDELNAELGGTCKLIYDDEGVLSCSRCGRHVSMIIASEDNFCSGCGRRIQKAVKR